MGKINPELLYKDQNYNPSDHLSDSEMFEFPTGDGALWGQVMRPDGSFGGSRPCVIFLHGFPGGNRNDDFAHALCRIGCVVLVLHHRGAWGSPGTYLVSNCIEDIKALAEHVRSEEFVNEYLVAPDQIYLFGHSMGGNNALNAGKDLPWLRGIMIMAPYDSTCYIRSGKPELLKDLMNTGAKFLKCDGAEALFADIHLHVEDWNFASTASLLKDQNLLIISGSYDDVAPEHDMVLPFWNELALYQTDAVRRHRSYPAGHALMGCRTNVLEDMVSFLEETL